MTDFVFWLEELDFRNSLSWFGEDWRAMPSAVELKRSQYTDGAHGGWDFKSYWPRILNGEIVIQTLADSVHLCQYRSYILFQTSSLWVWVTLECTCIPKPGFCSNLTFLSMSLFRFHNVGWSHRSPWSTAQLYCLLTGFCRSTNIPVYIAVPQQHSTARCLSWY